MRTKSTQKNQKIEPQSSWECFVFERIDKKFLYNDEKCENFTSFYSMVSEGHLQEYDSSEAVIVALANLWEKIEKDLAVYPTLSDEGRDNTANAVIAMATILGPSFYHSAVNKEPTLTDKYQYIISLPAKKSEETKRNNPVFTLPLEEDRAQQEHAVGGMAHQFSSDLSECLRILKEHVNNLSLIALNKDRVVYLSSLATHIQHLYEVASNSEIFQHAVADILVYLNDLGIKVKLPWQNDPGFIEPFEACWRHYLVEDSSNLFDKGAVEPVLEEVTRKIGEALAEKLRAENQLACINEQLAILEAQNPSRLSEKRKQQQELDDLGEKKATIKKHLTACEDLLHEAILPPEITLTNMEQKSCPVKEYPRMELATLEKLQRSIESLIKQHSLLEDNETIEPTDDDLLDLCVDPEASTEAQALVQTEHDTIEEPTGEKEPPLSEADTPKEKDSTTLTVESEESEVATLEIPVPDLEEVVDETFPVEVAKEPEREEETIDLQAVYEQDPRQFRIRIETSLKRYGTISSMDANVLALHCGRADLLNIAHFTLVTARDLCDEPEQIFSPELFEYAYYGMNVWSKSGRTFETSQRMLNTIDHMRIEEWLSKRPGNKSAPFFLFSAFFQSALFAGNETLAPQFLTQIEHHFDEITADLIADLVQFCNRGGVLTLEQLQRVEGLSEPTTQKASLRLSDWKDRIDRSTRGWAPVRMALSKCLKEGVFTEVVRTIRENNRSDSKAVKQFVDEYANEDKTRNLMLKTVLEYSPARIEANARESFFRTTNDLRDIASQWLGEQKQKKDVQDSIQEFTQKFNPRLKAVLESIQTFLGKAIDLEVILSAKIAEKCIRNLLATIDGKEEVVWTDERVDLWFRLPQSLTEENSIETEASTQLKWVLDALENSFDLNEMYRDAFDNGAYHVATLINVALDERGKDISQSQSELKQIVDRKLRDQRKRKEHLELAVDNANISGLLDDVRHAQLISELDYLSDAISNYSPLDDLRKIYSPLEQLDREINRKYAPRIKELTKNYRTFLQKAQTTIGDDAIPLSWQKQMEEALKNKDVPVVEEMIDAVSKALKDGTKIREESTDGNDIFAGFIMVADKIYEFLINNQDPHQILNAIGQGNPFELDFSNKPQNIKAAIRSIIRWRSHKPPKGIASDYYADIVVILSFLGIKPKTSFKSATTNRLNYQVSGGLARLLMRVESSNAGPPFTDFGQNQDRELDIIVSHKGWDEAKLERLLETDLVGKKRFILISTSPISQEQRNKFTKYCKINRKSIFLIDPVMMIYLGSFPQDQISSGAIRNFLHLSIPMTYYNSYVGDKQTPPDPEMRYGRLSEINQLMDLSQGAAIAFGGRQLGKSTILIQVQNRFNDHVNKKFAFYHHADADFGGHLSESKPEQREKRIWEIIYNDFLETGCLKKKNNLSTDDMRSAITDCLAKKNDLRVMIIFDEIDTFLELDHSNNFRVFRQMRELVSAPASHGRFKLIIAGLQNVKRFEDSPNYPLNQLGRSLNVSIMSVRDAFKLIKEPLQAYGYNFENSLVASRILSITNRHPSLIQIFCYELVEHLASNFSGDAGHQLISDSDITGVFKKDEVETLIRQRFEMTLNLDTRYAVIIYSLALEGRGTQSFTAAQVRNASTYWLPDLKKKTDKQIEAILEELVGLGVLRHASDQGFALRNSNILSLLGTNKDIETKLLQVISRNETMADPLERHAYIEESGIPSPLTFRDEKQILGTLSDEQVASKKVGIKRTHQYTVSLITGSKALGLDQLEHTLPFLDDFFLDWSEDKKQYSLWVFRDTKFISLSAFYNRLRRQVGDAQGMPKIILLEVMGERSTEEVLGMIDIAYQARDDFRKSYFPCKVVFIFHPKALWGWLTSSQNAMRYEQDMAHVSLDLWKRTGMRVLLEKIGFPNTDGPIEMLEDYCHGWYIAIHRLSQLKKKSPETTTLKKFGAKFKKITELTIKESQSFLDSTGINDVCWADPVLWKLMEEQEGKNFDVKVIKVIIEMYDIEGLPEELAEMALEWLSRLSLIKIMSSIDGTEGKSKEISFQIEPAIIKCLLKIHE